MKLIILLDHLYIIVVFTDNFHCMKFMGRYPRAIGDARVRADQIVQCAQEQCIDPD